MNRPGWDEKSCEPMVLGLTESQPVSCLHSVYRDTRSTVFDTHYELEIGIVRRGSMRREYREWSTTLGPGGVWLSGLWEPHRGRIVQAPCDVVVAVVYPDMLADLRYPEAPDIEWIAPFTSPPARRPRVRAQDREHVLRMGQRIRALGQQPDGPERRLMLRMWLVEFLLLLHGDWRADDGGDTIVSTGYARIGTAVRLVLARRRPVSAAEAARACRLSRSQFDRLFVKTMGIPFGRFEVRRRIHGAASQLRSSNAPLKAVARDWGFSNASHLTRRFIESYECTPGAYRRRG